MHKYGAVSIRRSQFGRVQSGLELGLDLKFVQNYKILNHYLIIFVVFVEIICVGCIFD